VDTSIWSCRVANSLTTSSRYVVSFTTQSTSNAQAMTALNFSGTDVSRLLVANTNAAVTNGSTAPGAGDCATTNAQHLRVRAIGQQPGNTSAMSNTAVWSLVPQARSADGTAGEVTIRGDGLSAPQLVRTPPRLVLSLTASHRP
jgi:hypothetical protein